MPDSRIAFRDVTIFDGSSFCEGQTVVINNRNVAAVGKAANVEVPLDAETVEGKGRTLLPGFIDAHVHIGFFEPKTVLRRGVTTARDLGWAPKTIFALVEKLKNSAADGPSLLAAGPIITAVGGYPSRAGWAPRGTALQVEDEGQGRDAVRNLAEQRAVIIKVAQDPRAGPVLQADLLKVVVEEAHRAGLSVTSHLGSLEQLEVALDAGVDELAHGLWSEENIPPSMIDRMVRQGITLVPTLHIDPTPARVLNLRRYHRAGGRVIYGTDMGNTGPPPGIDPEELRLMCEAGMSIGEVLASATSLAAEYLGLAGRGVIEEGARADLVLVEGDPRDDFRALANPIRVIRSA